MTEATEGGKRRSARAGLAGSVIDREEPVSREEAVVEALRDFVRHEAHQHEIPEREAPRIQPLQAVVLLVVVLNIVLLYGQFREIFENPLFKFALEALPWLLGAAAFAYSDRVRTWILDQARHPAVGVIALFVCLPLLMIREPVFSAVISVPYPSVRVEAENAAENLVFRTIDSTRIRLTVPNLLDPYSVKVTDEDEDLHPREFSHSFSRWAMVRGTVAQLPLVRQLFPNFSIPIEPLYEVMVDQTEHNGWVVVQGRFEAEFLRDIGELSGTRCTEYNASSPGEKAVRCRVSAGQFGAFPLPPGKYTIDTFRQDCAHPWKSEITVPKSDNAIEMEDQCPH